MHATQPHPNRRAIPPVPPAQFQVCPAKLMAQGLQDLARRAVQRRHPRLQIANNHPKPAA